MKKRLSIKTFIQLMGDRGFQVVFYFDRLKFSVDAATPESRLAALARHAQSQAMEYRSVPHHHTLCLSVDVMQPDDRYLKGLHKAIRGECRIQYLEIAMDILADDIDQMECLNTFFLSHLVHDRSPRQKGDYYDQRKSGSEPKPGYVYFGPREDDDVLVLYPREESKLPPHKPAVHLEYRLKKSVALKNEGIVSLQDVLELDKMRFLEPLLDLRHIPFNAVGRLAGSKASSEPGLVKAGKKFMEDSPALQSVFSKYPDWVKYSEPMDTKDKLGRWLDKYLR